MYICRLTSFYYRADYITEIKMIKSGKGVEEVGIFTFLFIQDLTILSVLG